MPNPYTNAGRALGSLLAGGGRAAGERAYQEGLQRGYTIDAAMQDAGRKRAQRLIDEQRWEQRNKLANTTPEEDLFLGAGYDPAQANFTRALVLSNDTVDLGKAGVFERPGARQALQDTIATLGDDVTTDEILAGNRAQQFLAGKEYDPVVISDGTIRNRGVALGDPEFDAIPTPRAAAQIAQGNARVAIARDKAARGPAPRGGGSGKPPSASQAEGQVLAEARKRIADGRDPKEVADYLVRKGYPGVAKKIYSAPKATATLGDDGY